MLSAVGNVLKDFILRLSHEADGLIFQGWDDAYVPRTHDGFLKWKYTNMNLVDFLFWVLGSIPIKEHRSLEILPMGALQRPLISPTVSVKNEIIVSVFPLTGALAKQSSYFSNKVLGFQ